MKKIILSLFTLGIAQFLMAQTADEALRYANQNYYGTARSSAMGGAFSSLGGDISVASTNPAGLAIFRNSTASITPGIRFSKSEGQGIRGENSTFVLPSAGFVFTSLNESAPIKNWNFGISYTQGANFNREKELTENATNFSILDKIAYDANNPTPYLPDALGEYKGALLPSLAYNTYLISPTEEGSYTPAIFEGELVNRMSVLEDKGNNGEIAFSVAGNFENTLYFGATLGIQNVDFESTDNYQEQLEAPTDASSLDIFYYDKYLHTRGTGVNLKLGLIYRATDALRLGIAAHTPTFFSLEDEYFYVMESTFFKEPEAGKGTSFQQVFPLDNKTGFYEYEYQTPWKFTFGGSYILGQTGLVSIDYDLIDYASSKFSNGDFDRVNQEISDTYKMTGNLKIGAEVRLNQLFALRGGYNYFGNMYSEESDREQNASQYSAGLGYRHKNIFVDASYQYYTQETTTNFDDFSATQDYNVHTVKVTIGYQF